MAEKVTRTLVDDMEDSEVVADAGTVPFGIDGRQYEIDLCRKNATRLRDFLRDYEKHGRLVGRAKSSTRSPSGHSRKSGGPSGYDREQLIAIRHWARRNGHPDLSNKGRVPTEILEAYERAHHGGSESLFSAS